MGGILVPLRGLPDPAALILKPPTRHYVVKPTMVYSTSVQFLQLDGSYFGTPIRLKSSRHSQATAGRDSGGICLPPAALLSLLRFFSPFS